MLHQGLIFLSFFLLGAFFVLFGVGVYKKLRRAAALKEASKNRKRILEKLALICSASETDFPGRLEAFVRDVSAKEKDYRDAVDSCLMGLLETPGAENRERLLAAARRLDFLPESLAQIRNRNPGISALGSRRAGLYNFTEAAGDMIGSLEILSSENQFEILMGLSRLRGADNLKKAFEKIKNNILINERAVIAILSGFPDGKEKEKLFRDMIHGDTHYLTALFLKALNRNMALQLSEDVVTVLRDGNNEVRAAAVRGLAALGKDAPSEILVQALEDADWEVRALAAKALGQVTTPEAGAALYRALFDQQWWVRQNAAYALANHPDYETLFLLAAESGDEYTRDSIIAALEHGNAPVLLRAIRKLAA